MSNSNLPQIWGYARGSTNKQQLGPELQKQRILAKAKQLADAGEGLVPSKDIHCQIEHASAERNAYSSRPVFKFLLEHMQPGDILIVDKHDRIDRNPFRFVAAVEHLARRKVRLISLDFGGMELDLKSEMSKIFVFIFAIALQMWRQAHADRCRETYWHHRKMGRAVLAWSNFGMKPVPRLEKDRNGQDVVRYYLEWDEIELLQILEIVHRRRAGQPWSRIEIDLWKRGVKRWHHYKRKRVSWADRSLRAAYKWAEKSIEETGAIGILPYRPPLHGDYDEAPPGPRNFPHVTVADLQRKAQRWEERKAELSRIMKAKRYGNGQATLQAEPGEVPGETGEAPEDGASDSLPQSARTA